jgi:hypothetical protein
VIVRRWQDYTGQQAHREVDDCLFDDLAAKTAAEPAVNSR